MIYLFAVLFGIALLAPYLHRLFRPWTGWVLSAVPAGAFVYCLTFIDPVLTEGQPQVMKYGWFPAMDVNLTFLVDGLSLFFALLITGVGTLIVLYGSGYLKGDPDIGRFYLMLLLFMGSMLGLVLASNLVVLFVFWEGTSFTSYFLIGYNHEEKKARRNALQALLITGIGGLAMFAGFLLIRLSGVGGGTFELIALLEVGAALRAHRLYVPIMILVAAGAVTKSAQFPFHVWLPNAMVAPTPVSAYLHSATMVKAGVYLLARLLPILGGTALWTGLIVPFGATTMLITAWLAICYTDLKQILAYSTLMILGLLVMLIGIGGEYAVKATVIMILAHALYKGTLFMVAGAVDHEAGTRDITQLNGLLRVMPITGTCACVAALSMAGIVPLIGFIGKEVFLEATLHADSFPVLFTGLGVVSSIGVIVSAGLVSVYPFLGGDTRAPEHPHEAPVEMWLGPVVLAGMSLLFGVWSSLIDTSLLSAAGTSMMGTSTEYHLALYHGLNTPLLLSGVSLAAALVVYAYWDVLRKHPVPSGYRAAFGWAPDRAYDYIIKGLKGTAYIQTRILQSGLLRNYLLIIFSTFFLLVGASLLLNTSILEQIRTLRVEHLRQMVRSVFFYEWMIVLLMIGGAFAAVWARTKLAAVISLGIAGFSVALLYMFYSAPDLAITQILVETLTVVLIALVMAYLPETPEDRAFTGRRTLDMVVAGGSGLVVTVLLMLVLTGTFDPELKEFFAEKSYLEGHGRNIVNVILVDFRALDTLGEITVLGTAAIGVYALINMRPEDESTDKQEEKGS